MLRYFICEACGVHFQRNLYPCESRRFCSNECTVKLNRSHGMSNTPEYISWRRMLGRCQNIKNDDYPRYGGRGIKVCERWLVFANFYADMGERKPGFTIDRIDNNGDYEPGNCKWSTMAEQNQNKRNITSKEHDRIIRDGVAKGMNFGQIAKLIGKSHGATSTRAYRLGLKSGQPPIPPRALNTAQPSFVVSVKEG